MNNDSIFNLKALIDEGIVKIDEGREWPMIEEDQSMVQLSPLALPRHGRRYHLTYVLDERGKPVPCDDIRVYGALLANIEKRTVARTFFAFRGLPVEVSTVFLVLNHEYGGGPPVLWETMIFTKHRRLSGYQVRYTSRADAEDGHRIAVEYARYVLRSSHLPSPRRARVAQRRKSAGQDVLRRRPV